MQSYAIVQRHAAAPLKVNPTARPPTTQPKSLNRRLRCCHVQQIRILFSCPRNANVATPRYLTSLAVQCGLPLFNIALRTKSFPSHLPCLIPGGSERCRPRDAISGTRMCHAKTLRSPAGTAPTSQAPWPALCAPHRTPCSLQRVQASTALANM